MGVAWPPALLSAPVVSYTTFSPLPDRSETDQSDGRFLWPFPRVAPPGCYPAPCSVERGLSSDGFRRPRSPGQPSCRLHHTFPRYSRQPTTPSRVHPTKVGAQKDRRRSGGLCGGLPATQTPTFTPPMNRANGIGIHPSISFEMKTW